MRNVLFVMMLLADLHMTGLVDARPQPRLGGLGGFLQQRMEMLAAMRPGSFGQMSVRWDAVTARPVRYGW